MRSLILAFNLSDSTRRELVWGELTACTSQPSAVSSNAAAPCRTDIITNKQAIQINQIWAGSPGGQALWGLGDNNAVEVWTKPLGDGRLAAFILNTANGGDENATVAVTIPLAKLNLTDASYTVVSRVQQLP